VKLETKSAIAREFGCRPSAVTNAIRRGALHETQGKIDIHDVRNRSWFEHRLTELAAKAGQDPDQDPGTRMETVEIGGSVFELNVQKLRADIALKHARRRALDLQNAAARKDLIPADLMAVAWGHFGSAVKLHLLQLPARVGRGDLKLKLTLEKAISKAIKAVLRDVARGLRSSLDRTEYGDHDEQA
jgi:phage terminase Nu1 subunit (DNA packaging protein)